MIWGANVALSIEVLASHRLRTGLSISGIIIGVASVVIMVAVGIGTERKIMERIASMGTNLVFVVAGETRVSGGSIRRSSSANTLKAEDARAIARECPSVEMTAGSIKRSIIVRWQGQTVKAGLIGLEPDGFAIRNLKVAHGRPYEHLEERLKRRVAVFAPTAARNTFGSDSGVGQAVRLARQPFRVIGLTEPKGLDLNGSDQDDKIFIPLGTAMRRLVNVDHIDTIFVKVRDGVPLSRAEDEIRDLLRRRHKIAPNRSDDFSVYNQLDLVRLQKNTTRSLTLLVGSTAALAWVIGGFGILAVMLMAVRERRPEIGLRRAVGARDKDILYQFLVEAALLAGFGSLAGLLLGIAGVWLTRSMAWAPAVMPWTAALAALAATVLLGLICGIYPAMRASRLTPVEALNL